MDEETRRAAAGHVRYERAMLRATAGYLVAAREDDPRFHHYAQLESFLMHVRNLWDFLDSNGDRPDDVLAKLYNDDGSWRASSVPPEVKLINKHVAHITTKRLVDLAWNVPGLEAVTLQGFAEFLETVTPGRRPWFDWIELQA